MRVVWRDSKEIRVSKVYRGYTVYGISVGWGVDYPEDNNIYRTRMDAFNAIDKHLNGRGKRGVSKSHPIRQTGEVRIVGKIDAL